MQDAGGETGLDSYMRMPVEQYALLEPKLIQAAGGGRFVLTVPRIHVRAVCLSRFITRLNSSVVRPASGSSLTQLTSQVRLGSPGPRAAGVFMLTMRKRAGF